MPTLPGVQRFFATVNVDLLVNETKMKMRLLQKFRSVLLFGPCSAETSAATKPILIEFLVVFLTASMHMPGFSPASSLQDFPDSQFESSSHRHSMVGDTQSIVIQLQESKDENNSQFQSSKI